MRFSTWCLTFVASAIGCAVAGSGVPQVVPARGERAHAPPSPVCAETCLSLPPPRTAAPASRADTTRLARAFADAGYAPPEGTHLLVGRELDGAPTAFEWFSLGDTGFVPSPGRYWPASTVKLAAAVGALEALSERGLTGAAVVTFTDDDGRYHGTVREIARLSVQVSDNPSYNRTLLLAGTDALNAEIFPSWGLHHTRFTRRYTRPDGVDDLALVHSPEIRFREGDRTGVLPARVGRAQFDACPRGSNCTSLYELLEVMRRLVLHRELPEDERFRLGDDDVDALLDALRASRSRLTRGAEAALGDVVVYNKTGTVPGDDRLDHGLVVDRLTGRRYLLAMSLRWATTENEDAEELARQALEAMR